MTTSRAAVPHQTEVEALASEHRIQGHLDQRTPVAVAGVGQPPVDGIQDSAKAVALPGASRTAVAAQSARQADRLDRGQSTTGNLGERKRDGEAQQIQQGRVVSS